jgi:hypothetical protein
MIKWLVTIGPCDEQTAVRLMTGWLGADADPALERTSDHVGTNVRLGVDKGDALIGLLLVKSVMASIAENANDRDLTLTWEFSQVSVAIVNLPILLDQWEDSGQPPVLSIVALELGKSSHHVRGVEAFAGHRLSVNFGDPAQSREAARNLARLARYALVNGAIDDQLAYEGVNGEILALRRIAGGRSTDVVTIIL